MGQTGKRDPDTGELVFEEDGELLNESEYFKPKGDPKTEIAQTVAFGRLGVAGCPKCGKPLNRRMTAMGPKWVCGCSR